MPHVPDTIGPYEVIRPIAQGGMAEVFEVRDPDSGERRALKLLVELKTSVKRFNREFEAMTRLNHPNIVRVYRYGYHGPNPWMSMELLRGVPLQVRVKDFGPPGSEARNAEVVRIAWHVANALQYIHDRGLVHRDLKSANVQVLRDGRVKLLDFGTAHLVDPLERITQEGDFVGTFSYAAPEQIIGARIDHRADLYALGILLYRLLSGRRPYKSDDPHKVAHMHLHEQPKRLAEVLPSVPRELDELVHWLLQKQRKDRPERADQVAAVLERVAGRGLVGDGGGIALYEDLALERATELRQAWKTLGEAPTGHVMAVVGGDRAERGWFFDHFTASAAERGLRVARAHAEEGAQGLARAVHGLVEGDDDEAEGLRDLLAHLARSPGSGVEAAVRAALGREAEGPAVLLLDDAERATHDAIATLVRLVEDADTFPAPVHLIVGADREDLDVLRTLRRVAAGASVVKLTPLDPRRTALAVGNLLHRRPPPPAAARRIHEATGGRPALIVDVVRAMVEDGRLTLRDDQGNFVEWRDEDDDGSGLASARVREALEERVGTLPQPWRRVLEVVDLLGGVATTEQIGWATGTRPADLELVLDELVEEGLLRRENHGWVPEEPVIARFLGETMSPYRRCAVQHLVADLVERQPPSPAQVRLLVAVGRSGSALERAMACARDMLDHGRVADAVDLLEVVHTHADHPGLRPELRVGFHLLFAEALQRVKPMDVRAVRSLETAERLAAGTADLARVRFAQAERQRAIGHYVNHRRLLLEAWEVVENGPRTALRAAVALELADSHVYGAQHPQARSWYDTALDAAMAVDDRDIADRARIGLASLQIAAGEVEAAEEVLKRLILARGERGDPLVRWLALATWGHALRRQGRYSDALPRLHAAVGEARDGQSVTAWASVTLAAAACELDLYRLGRAQELLEELASALGPGEQLHVRLETRLLQGRLQLASGQPHDASFLLEEVVDHAEKAGLVLLSELGRAYLAEARWVLGAQEESKALYQKALLGLMATGELCALADAVVSRARVVGATEDPTKAFRLVRRLLARGKLLPLYIEHLLAEMRWYQAIGELTLARQNLRETQNALNRLAAAQSTIEQATLRVHPWAHEISAVAATHD